MKLVTFLLLALCIFCNRSYAEHHNIIVAAKSYFPPMSYIKNNQLTGISFSLLDQIIANHEIIINYKKSTPLPWLRAINNAKQGKIDIILGLEKGNSYDDFFTYSSMPLFESAYNIFYLKDQFSNATVNHFLALRGGVTRNFSIDRLAEKGLNFTRLEPVRSLEQNIKKLIYGRIQFFIAPALSTADYLSTNFPEAAKKIIFISSPVVVTKHYIATSKVSSIGLSLVKKLDDAIVSMHEKGEIESLIGEQIAQWPGYRWYIERIPTKIKR